jgi:hypothetical protein
MRGETVPQGMNTDTLGNAGACRRPRHRGEPKVC